MTTNAEYAKTFESDPSRPLRIERLELRKKAQKEWEDDILAEQKRRHPRRKKNFPGLPDEFYDDLRAEILARYDLDEIDRRIDELDADKEQALNQLAPGVVFEPDPNAFYKIETSSTNDYRSQGYGASTYARGRLSPVQDRLHALGFETHVRFVVTWRNPDAKWSCDAYGGNYELWANAPEWMTDAADRTMTLGDTLESMKRNGVNPLVYYPFLPRELAY